MMNDEVTSRLQFIHEFACFSDPNYLYTDVCV